ncbi:MAG: aldehyde dehydrogenase [Rhodospirillales bacterium]|nr:aldehyde dehydrogenase [Rhodospirillales bacterium]
MNIGLLIDGDNVAAEKKGTFERHNPVTGTVAVTAAASRQSDVDKAVASAHAAFKSWSKTGPSERRTILNRAADLFDEQTAEFVAIGIQETGATAPWIGFNVMFAAKILREAAAMTTQIKGEVIPSDKPGTLAMSLRQPVGVIVGIAPWNAAVILGVRAIAMPIACGNSVVFKASEKCPKTHRMIGDILLQAGLPKGVLNVLTHAPDDAAEVTSALIAHPDTKRINFTGSTKVGRIVAEQAGRHLKPCLLELGGKAPLVVLEDANIEAAVNAAAFGAFMNQGQICMSTERIIVDAKIADAFVDKLAAKAAKLPSGNPTDPVVLGSVVDAGSITHASHLIENACAAGAKLLVGGVPKSGTIMAATILDHVSSDMEAFSSESFCPMVCITRARDTDHAIELANMSEFGLSAAVFGSDINRALDVAKSLETGICHINGPTVSDEAQMPFGGMKGSGYGRFGGSAGIDAFTELRWITIEDPDQHYPF